MFEYQRDLQGLCKFDKINLFVKSVLSYYKWFVESGMVCLINKQLLWVGVTYVNL